MKAMVAIITSLGVLTACSVGPEYRRPNLDVPGSYRFQEEQPGGKSIADLAWWEVYRDKQLQAILQTALNNNRDVKIAAARVAEARAQAGVSRLARLPQVNVAVGDTRQKSLVLGRYATFEVASGLAQVSFEVDLWKRLKSLSDAARASLLATEYARDAVKVTLVSDVASAYFNLLALDQQLHIIRNSIANSEKFLALTQTKSRQGAASDLDVSRAQANLSSVKANQADILRQIAQTENQLQILLGKNPDALARGTLDGAAITPIIPAGLPATLLERRPDLRQAEAGLIGATANVRAAKAALFPAISLTGSYGSQSLAFLRLFSGSTQVWSYGLNFLQPIIDYQRNGDMVNAARMREAQALLQYQNTVAQAFREVSDALVAWQSYSEFLRDEELQVKSLQEANSHVLRRYEVGYSSYFEVIDAQNSLYAAQLQRVQAYRSSQLSLVQLYKALGGGWAVPATP